MRETLSILRGKLRPLHGYAETEAIIRLIFHYVKGWKLVDIIMHEPEALSDFTRNEIAGILSRLLNREPIQYIVGEARFHGLDLKVTPDVLIPRPETSELVDIIIDRAKGKTDLHVLDIGSGSGCIAIALSLALKFPIVEGIDISSGAVDLARVNAHRCRANVTFKAGDVFLWDSLRESYDVIVSNPPYVADSEKEGMESEVLDHEPHGALFVRDDNPLVFYNCITGKAREALKEGGMLYYEINPIYALELKENVENAGFGDVELLRDSYGKTRFLVAKNVV